MKTTTAENILKRTKSTSRSEISKIPLLPTPWNRQYSWCAYTSTADNGKRYNQER